MKAVVHIDITVTFQIEGNWDERCDLRQVQNDAEQASIAIVTRLHRSLDAADSRKVISTKRTLKSVTLIKN